MQSRQLTLFDPAASPGPEETAGGGVPGPGLLPAGVEVVDAVVAFPGGAVGVAESVPLDD